MVGAGLREKIQENHQDPEPQNVVEIQRAEIRGDGKRSDPPEHQRDRYGDKPRERRSDLRFRKIVNEMENGAEDHRDVDGNITDENVKTVVAPRDEHRHQDQGRESVGKPVGQDERRSHNTEEDQTTDHLDAKRDDQHCKQKERSVKTVAEDLVLIPFFREQGFSRLGPHKNFLLIKKCGFGFFNPDHFTILSFKKQPFSPQKRVFDEKGTLAKYSL